METDARQNSNKQVMYITQSGQHYDLKRQAFFPGLSPKPTTSTSTGLSPSPLVFPVLPSQLNCCLEDGSLANSDFFFPSETSVSEKRAAIGK